MHSPATSMQPTRRHGGFTLLEVVIVLAIVGMLLSVIFSITQGTLTLADDIQRHQRRDSRLYAYIDFCEHLLTDLPATTALNIQTTQDGAAYLSKLELQNVSSPFDGAPQQIVIMQTEPLTGGGMRMVLSSRKMPDPKLPLSQPATAEVKVVLFDNLSRCEWRAFDPASQRWTPLWSEQLQTATPAPVQPTPTPTASGGAPPAAPHVTPPTPVRSLHPPMLELQFATGIDPSRRWVFWIPPSDSPQP